MVNNFVGLSHVQMMAIIKLLKGLKIRNRLVSCQTKNHNGFFEIIPNKKVFYEKIPKTSSGKYQKT
jgi:acyl-coenzyme A synthetase/AMP-(fatty) acid ligase